MAKGFIAFMNQNYCKKYTYDNQFNNQSFLNKNMNLLVETFCFFNELAYIAVIWKRKRMTPAVFTIQEVLSLLEALVF